MTTTFRATGKTDVGFRLQAATSWDMARGLAHYRAYMALGLLNNSFSGESRNQRAILADYERTVAAIDAKEARMARYNAALQGRLHA